jgi:hypothetical protein
MASNVSDATKSLTTALERFRDVPSTKNYETTINSTSPSDLQTYLQKISERSRPDLVNGLKPIIQLFEHTCTIGVEIGAVVRESMLPLFGTIQCTMLVAQNEYEEMELTAKLLEVVGHNIPSVPPGSVCSDKAQLWGVLVHMSCEIIGLCSSIASKGRFL